MNKFRVMSFNIKNSRSNEGTIFSWKHRKEKVIQIVQNYKPDVIGFQEVFVEQLEYLAEQLSPEYSYEGVGRDDGVSEGEFCPIFYKGLSSENSGTFWYSDTPEDCSNTWKMYLPRICTWINFKDSIAFYNTHLDDRDPKARKRSFELLLKQMEKYSQNKRVVLVGDLNCGHNSREIAMLKERFLNSYWEKNKSLANRSVSFHGFKGNKISFFAFNGRRVIDHIMVSKNIETINSKLSYHNIGGHKESFPSDHWPILANLEIK
jgi:endonuclease/exonuclease/phosphatase family metal-dependent hydrolase